MTPTNRILTSVVISLIVAFLAIAISTIYFNHKVDESQARVFHTYAVIDDSKSLAASLRLVESSQRGYLLTGRKLFLDQYQEGLGKISLYLDKVKSETADNEVQQERLRDIESLMLRRLDILARAIDLQQNNGFEAAQALIAGGDGAETMEDIRVRLTDFVRYERDLLGKRRTSAENVEDNTDIFLFLGGALALITMLGVSLILARNNFKLAMVEKNLASEAVLLQGTLNNIRDGVATFDSDGKLLAFNMLFFELLSFPFEMAKEGTTLSNFQDIDQHRNHPAFSQLPNSEDSKGYERLSLNGRELDVYRNLLPDGGFLIGAVEVTERVRAETISRQAQKMEAIGHLTGGVAHDFNNLLQIISANLDLLTNDIAENSKAAERLQNAITGVERGSRLTQQLLAFARRQPLDPRPVNLGRLIHDMTELLRHTLGEIIDVEAVISGGLWNTSVDPVQVENTILNLALNARDAMHDGGKMTIEISNAVLDDSYALEHQEVVPGQYVMLAVSDTGTGMDPEVMSRVFEPFFTTKPEGRGTGLGLSQVYGFVKQSGGHVKVYSELGHGTTIRIYLPRTRKAQNEQAITRDGPVPGGSETILVVEDDAGVRTAAMDLLKDLGYSTLKAENADEALALLESGARPDLLFTDVVMPGQINTRDFARMARTICPQLSILFTSGYTQNAIVHNGKLDEDVFLLSKPYRKSDLARKIRSVLDMPSASQKNISEIAAVEPPEAATGSTHKILLVEDEPLVRMSTMEMLEELGYSAEETDNALSALEILEKNREIDILITDLGLEGMSGTELVDQLGKKRPDLKIIVASGYEPTDIENDKIVYLAKPFLLGDLKKALSMTMSLSS